MWITTMASTVMAMVRAGTRSGVLWQVAIGFVLGTAGTLATHHAQASPQPAYHGAAPHWRIDRQAR